MGNVTFIYPSGIYAFPRSYIRGFVGSSDITNFSYDGVDLDFDYLFPLIHVTLRVSERFRAASSNRYTTDYVFDVDNCWVYISGSPSPAGVGLKMVAMQTEFVYRIQVLATLSIDETIRADLPQLEDYWRPSFS